MTDVPEPARANQPAGALPADEQVVVAFDDYGATLRPPHATPFRLHLEQIVLRLLWSEGEGDAARRGHAYLLDRGSGPLELVLLQHGLVRHAEMMELLARVDARLPPADGPVKLRASTWWSAPGPLRWSFTGDAGALADHLRGRSLVVRREQDPAEPRWPDQLPLDFLADPVGTLVRTLIGDLHGSTTWDANALRPRVLAARAGDLVVVCACRHGSIHADAGQDRTAAVFVSRDGDRSFVELPWRLSPAQAASSAGRFSWPPEQIDRVVLTDDQLVIEWDDPWIDWEPGNEWLARWDAAAGLWTMRTR